jgi:choline dehydrogenase-like flavoprotein
VVHLFGDYGRCGADSGMTTWDHAPCLPYFKRLETSAVSLDDELRGHDGPELPERGAAADPLFAALFAAAQQAGHPLSKEMNGRQQEGFAALGAHHGARPALPWASTCKTIWWPSCSTASPVALARNRLASASHLMPWRIR